MSGLISRDEALKALVPQEGESYHPEYVNALVDIAKRIRNLPVDTTLDAANSERDAWANIATAHMRAVSAAERAIMALRANPDA